MSICRSLLALNGRPQPGHVEWLAEQLVVSFALLGGQSFLDSVGYGQNAARPSCQAFFLAAWNSGVSTSSPTDSMVGGPSLESNTSGKDAAVAISLSPSRMISWARRT